MNPVGPTSQSTPTSRSTSSTSTSSSSNSTSTRIQAWPWGGCVGKPQFNPICEHGYRQQGLLNCRQKFQRLLTSSHMACRLQPDVTTSKDVQHIHMCGSHTGLLLLCDEPACGPYRLITTITSTSTSTSCSSVLTSSTTTTVIATSNSTSTVIATMIIRWDMCQQPDIEYWLTRVRYEAFWPKSRSWSLVDECPNKRCTCGMAAFQHNQRHTRAQGTSRKIRERLVAPVTQHTSCCHV